MAVRAGVSEAEDGLEIPRSGTARTLWVMLVLVVDAALAAAGGWMIRDHLRAPAPAAVVTARADVDAGAQLPSAPVAAAPRPAAPITASPSPTPAPAPRREPPPPAPQPERSLTDRPPSRPPSAAPAAGEAPPRLPVLLRPRLAPDAAPPPVAAAPEPEPEETASTPDAGREPDHAWIDSMTRGIRNVVEDHRDLIEDCYLRAAKPGTAAAPVQGRVEVHLRIEPEGDASEVRVVENQTGSEELGTCLVTIMRTWRYPAPGQEAMEFVWPFNFQAARGPGVEGR